MDELEHLAVMGGIFMGEPWQTILRVAIGIGIAIFLWSFATSMEKIANALTRLADAKDVKDKTSTTDDPPKTNPG
jgi:hypothetical protein